MAALDMIRRWGGEVTTIVAGQIVHRDGQDTGARPGRLLRLHRGRVA